MLDISDNVVGTTVELIMHILREYIGSNSRSYAGVPPLGLKTPYHSPGGGIALIGTSPVNVIPHYPLDGKGWGRVQI